MNKINDPIADHDAISPTTGSLSKHFDYQTSEGALYEMWESSKAFQPAGDGPVFNICMPPPNANGELHIGHSFGYTIKDILGRFHRLLGDQVLLLPGKDHAGIQTQVVFEKKLKSEGIDYKSVPSTELFKQCYDFCLDRSNYMRNQERTLGISADWSRELFTLDPRLTEIVYETFERLWRDGLVYRGHRIINWSVFSQTGISDVEVEYKEAKGSLWYICYPLVDGAVNTGEMLALSEGKSVEIGVPGIFTATTRPETMLGDTALAVHPEDSRYSKFIGKKVRVPLIGREIPIVADNRVDPKYGTGVIKVTPAHDFLDYDIGQDHKLEAIQVIGKDGLMTAAAGGKFAGLKVDACRAVVVEALNQEQLLFDIQEMTHKVPIGERGKDIIEPLISEQWFLNVDKPGNSLKGRALELIRSGKIKIYPARFQVLFEQWLENLRDWNISRQLWWGHRMPVWYHRNGEIYVGKTPPPDPASSPEHASSPDQWRQDTDTFDTWFSSGQWAFSTLAAHGLLDLDNPKTSKFFPSHTMVMGRDILLFWACRMLLLTTYRLGEAPWKNIFFTGLIRDEHGQKMSKSKGNGIEPKEMISKFGTDALRLALVMGASPGNDINIGPKKVEGYSKFINKIWNAAKLIELKLGSEYVLPDKLPSSFDSLSANWMFAQLEAVRSAVTQKMGEYEISISATELYNFTWQVYCDWYLEFMKVLVDRAELGLSGEIKLATALSFRALVTMLHPVIPFVTEELYQKLPFLSGAGSKMLITASWPASLGKFERAGLIDEITEVVNGIRSVKAILGIPHQSIRVALSKSYNAEGQALISGLARVSFCEPGQIAKEKALKKPVSSGSIICEVDNKELYRERLLRDLESNKKMAATLSAKLSGSFAELAKPEIVALERERLATAERTVAAIGSELSAWS